MNGVTTTFCHEDNKDRCFAKLSNICCAEHDACAVDGAYSDPDVCNANLVSCSKQADACSPIATYCKAYAVLVEAYFGNFKAFGDTSGSPCGSYVFNYPDSAVCDGDLTQFRVDNPLRTTMDEVNFLYRRYLGRTGELSGLHYWTDILDNKQPGADREGGFNWLANHMQREATEDDPNPEYHAHKLACGEYKDSPEVIKVCRDSVNAYIYHNLHPQLDHETFHETWRPLPESIRPRIEQLYKRLLGRAGDEGGLDYWTSEVSRRIDTYYKNNPSIQRNDNYIADVFLSVAEVFRRTTEGRRHLQYCPEN